jgi:hypothetical protein
VTTQGRLARFEVPLTLAIAAGSAAWAWHSQVFQVFRYWDSDEYFLMALQFAAGETVTAAAPYAYRVLVPWLVAACCDADIQRGFLLVNLFSGMALPILLIYWLRPFVARPGVRVLMATACALQWLAPIRFAFYYPAYVDPLFQVFMLAALIAGEHLFRRPSIGAGLAYALLIGVGTMARETMLVVPACGLIAGAQSHRQAAARRVGWVALGLTAGMIAYLGARVLLDPRGEYRFLDAISQQLANKPLFSLLLAPFLAFGPMIALVAYDWRPAREFVKRRLDLAALLALFVVLAYVGGTDTERLLFWAMPVVYLLIAQSIERHYAVVSTAAVAAVVIAGQVLAERVPWAVPDPGTAVTPLSEAGGSLAKLYAILNRVFVIDDFHWNLWSNFGSRPFHLVQLAFYLSLSVAIVTLMRRRAMRAAISG